ncbi:hypothetical protein JCM8097_006984 [Rhodosporidiobolus ruineniae]
MAPSIRPIRTARGPPPSSFRQPPSPTLSATTQASQLDLGDDGPKVIVTRADLRESVQAYEQLLAAAKGYRNALVALSQASTGLAGALGECARVKGAGESGEQLMAASGLQYMVANSGQVLSDTLYRSFEVPLLTAYDSYVGEIAQRHAEYEALLADKTAKIRETEAENMRQGRKKTRDLNQFRIALAKLQEQVAEVEVCKRSYYSEVLENETEMWGMIGGKISLLVRSTLDLADRLASKATSDPIIESMLNEHPDPFDSYRLETDEERDVFTILPPINLSIAGSSGNSPVAQGKKPDGAVEAKEPKERDEIEDKALTPRQASKQPVSVSDVLGLNDVSEEEEDAPTRATPTARSKQAASAPTTTASSKVTSPLHSRTPSHSTSSQLASAPLSPSRPRPSAASTSSTPSPPTPAADLPALAPSTAPDLTPSLNASAAPFEPPSLTTESAPFSTLSRTASAASSLPGYASSASADAPTTQPSPTKSRHGPRGLSRLSEASIAAHNEHQHALEDDVDGLAGDWSAPVYGRELSPALMSGGGGGYDSAEEEAEGWRG